MMDRLNRVFEVKALWMFGAIEARFMVCYGEWEFQVFKSIQKVMLRLKALG